MTLKLIQQDFNFTITKKLSDAGEFEGYASTFGNEDTYGDVIAKGAFVDGLKKLANAGRKLKMLWNHDRQQPIGVFSAAAEDSHGLIVVGKLTKGVQKADETRLLMLDGAVDSMSIGGYITKEVRDNKTGKSLLTGIELREISPVTFEANDQARIISVKSLDEIGTMGELESLLRDVGGFSLKDAKAIISKAKACVTPRDVAADEVLKSISNTIRNLNI